MLSLIVIKFFPKIAIFLTYLKRYLNSFCPNLWRDKNGEITIFIEQDLLNC